MRARGVGGNGSVPHHLRHWVLTDLPAETCPWSLSGPQFPQPTAIQQRYCYPKGDPDYAGRKGGALWTMYGRDGKEDFEFRLLHVYFSAKRAINKGVTLSAEDRMKQQLQAEAANAAVTVMAGTPKRAAKRVSRAVRSPWQERATNQAAAVKRKLCAVDSSPPENSKWARRSGSPFRDGRMTLLPPPSPFQTRRIIMGEREDATIFVSPNTAGSSDQQSCREGQPFDHSMFDHPPFHMVSSFDIEEPVKPGPVATQNACPFRNASGREQYEPFLSSSGRSLIEGSDSFAFNEADATELGGNVVDSWNDPLLPLSSKASFECSDNKNLATSPHGNDRPLLTSAEALKSRLGHVHERIREGILSHPGSEQGPLLSIVASWARAVATSPLAPTIQRFEVSQITAVKDEPKTPFFHATAV